MILLQTTEVLGWIDRLEVLIAAIVAILGTLLGAMLQYRITMRSTKLSHAQQIESLQETHRHSLEMFALSNKRDESMRLRQYEEADRADRLLIDEYVDLILPRLTEISSIRYISASNLDEQEGRKYRQLETFMFATTVDPAHPEKNLNLRLTFLLCQLMGAFRLALNARWTRPISEEQSKFLMIWENKVEPIFCSGRYPGVQFLYREQVEMISEMVLIKDDIVGMTRPLNWAEFCAKLKGDQVWSELVETMADKLRLIFDERNKPLPLRKAMQCRLAILALYLIHISREAGNNTGSWREDGLWFTVSEWFKWQEKERQEPKWFVFAVGDAENWRNPSPA